MILTIDNQQFEEAVRRLKAGEVVAYPTETLYGLGCDPFNQEAVNKLLELKTRYNSEGVTLIADESFQAPVGLASELAAKHWPGPLTMVLDLDKEFADGIRAQDESVGVRVSSSKLCRDLASSIGGFITATSANPHGAPPAKTMFESRDYFSDIFTFKAPSSLSSVASTIVDVRGEKVKVLRVGDLKVS